MKVKYVKLPKRLRKKIKEHLEAEMEMQKIHLKNMLLSEVKKLKKWEGRYRDGFKKLCKKFKMNEKDRRRFEREVRRFKNKKRIKAVLRGYAI